MEKTKNFLKNIINIFKKAFERFPLTLGSICLFTLFTSILIDSNIINSTTWLNIYIFTLFFISGCFFAESIYPNKEYPKKRILIYVLSSIIAILFTTLQNFPSIVKNYEVILLKILTCYISTLIIISIYFLYKQSEHSFEHYILKVFSNITKTTFIYGILALGITIIYGIFIYLILDIKFDLLARLQLVLFGIFYIPKLIYSLVDVQNEVSGFFKGLVKYVLNSLLYASFIIIYIYILKILTFRDMPKNQVFRILSTLFIIGMPIWTMSQHYKENDFWYKINSKLPIAFIPFILLQIYAVWLRISNYGFTPARYLSVILILFEIIYVVIYITKKCKLENLLLVCNGLIIVSLIVPVINMFSISNISQYNRLKLYLQKSEYSDKEKYNIYSAYTYLKHSVDGTKYINKLNENDIKKINSFYDNKYTYNNYNYINATKKLDKISLDGYLYMYFINNLRYSIENKENYKKENNNLDNTTQDNNIEISVNDYPNTINITNAIKNYVKVKETFAKTSQFHDYFENNYEIVIDTNTKLIIKSLNIRYNASTLDISSCTITGYLLVK